MNIDLLAGDYKHCFYVNHKPTQRSTMINKDLIDTITRILKDNEVQAVWDHVVTIKVNCDHTATQLMLVCGDSLIKIK